MDILIDWSFFLFSEKASCYLPPPWWKCTNQRVLLTNALCWIHCFLSESKFYNLGLGSDKGRQQSKVTLLFTVVSGFLFKKKKKSSVHLTSSCHHYGCFPASAVNVLPLHVKSVINNTYTYYKYENIFYKTLLKLQNNMKKKYFCLLIYTKAEYISGKLLIIQRKSVFLLCS